MTFEEAQEVELMPGITVWKATKKQWEEHAALCERMVARIRAMSVVEFEASRDIYEAWQKQNDRRSEAAAVIKAEIKRQGALK